MHRLLYALGLAYVVASAVLIATRPARSGGPSHPLPPVEGGGPGEWFAGIRPFCNPVEVEVALRQHQPPTGFEGSAYSAACLALAGKVDRARLLIDALPVGERARAAGVVFEVAHPVADAGDDQAAGPIMELVIAYWPNHYMALYHAGMSEYALGQVALARSHLQSFLYYYHEDDGWTRNARDVLARLR